MAEIRHKKVLVVRPTGMYHSYLANDLVCLTAPLIETRFRQSQDNLANGPMERANAHTGPDHTMIGASNG
jgi:hypothetical protein